MATTGPLKWHGGKQYLASKIVALMPPRLSWCHYVEPYAGGLAVLLANDPEGISEVVNDKNTYLTNFWAVLASDDCFVRFLRIVEVTPFSEVRWQQGMNNYKCGCRDAKAAVDFFVACRQSLAGRMKSFAPLSRNRVRRGMNEQVSAWLNAVEGLPAVHARLKRVLILNHDAPDVIRQQDGDKTLFYLDPTYPHETRASTDDYEHEMSMADHCALLGLLGTIKGRFLLSGYACPVYEQAAARNGWKRHDFDIPNNAAGGDTKRRMTECVWTNY